MNEYIGLVGLKTACNSLDNYPLSNYPMETSTEE